MSQCNERPTRTGSFAKRFTSRSRSTRPSSEPSITRPLSAPTSMATCLVTRRIMGSGLELTYDVFRVASMIRKAFRMSVHAGQQAEYERRHRPIWKELEDVLIAQGVHTYSIYLDEQ